MQKKEDLRVIKTKRAIKQVFHELIKKKPVEKITVTEIARLAEINKGTFYLHYRDIYELYDEFLHDFAEELADRIDFLEEFFTAPAEFTRKFVVLICRSMKEEHPFVVEDDKHNRQVPQLFADIMKKRLYSLKKIEPSIQNDIKLDAILASVMSISFRYGESNPKDVIAVMSASIRQMFPK